jgi:hypothetical protein
MALTPFSRNRRTPGAAELEGAGSVFLGSLRSEFDEEVHLHPSFSSLLAAASAVRAAYLTNRLGAEDAAGAFAELRLAGNDEVEWTVGAASGRWYRRLSGGDWEASGAPVDVVPADGQEPRWLTASVTVLLEPSKSAQPQRVRQSEPEKQALALPLPELPDVDEEVDWLLSEWASSAEQELTRQVDHGQGHDEDAESGPVEAPVAAAPETPFAEAERIAWSAPEKYWWRSEDAVDDALDTHVVGDTTLQRSVPGPDGAEATPVAGLPATFPDDVAVRDLTVEAAAAPAARAGASDNTVEPGWEPATRASQSDTTPTGDYLGDAATAAPDQAPKTRVDEGFAWSFGAAADPAPAAKDDPAPPTDQPNGPVGPAAAGDDEDPEESGGYLV